MRHSARRRLSTASHTTPEAAVIARAVTIARGSGGAMAPSRTHPRRRTVPVVMLAVARLALSVHRRLITRLPERVTARVVTPCRAPRKGTGAAAASVTALHPLHVSIATWVFARSGRPGRRPLITRTAAPVIVSAVTGRRARYRPTGPAPDFHTARRLRHAMAVMSRIVRQDRSVRRHSIMRLPEPVIAGVVTP